MRPLKREKRVQITSAEISDALSPGGQACLKRACDKIVELALLDFDQLTADSCIFIDRILIRSDGSFICKMVDFREIAVSERKLNIADCELESIKQDLLSYISKRESAARGESDDN